MSILFAIIFLIVIFKCVGLVLGVCGKLLGAVLSSTDAASVFSILRSKRLSLRFHTASMLELESGMLSELGRILRLIGGA